MKNMDAHLRIPEIIRLAMKGEYHTHFLDCAFCREQYEDALHLESFLEGVAEIQSADSTAETPPSSYRLAAQSSDDVSNATYVRRTWYLEDGNVILRVMEDTEKQILYGHLVIDPERLATSVVRFSGIDMDFSPDDRGLFDIGSTSMEIERMEVAVSRTGEK